jgi:ketosteroid isomerase-like protein
VFITARFKEDKEPIRREVWETLVFRKSAGSWHLIEEHSTQAAPKVPATP